MSAILAGCLLAACTTEPVRSDSMAVAAPAVSGSAIPVSRPISEQIPSNPTTRSAKAHTELGMAYMRSARNGVAMDEARIAIKADAGYAPAHLLMGMVYALQEQPELGRPYFEEAVRLAPGDPEINTAYGWFLCSQGKEADGLRRIEAAARNPYFTTPGNAWMSAGMCLLRMRDYPAAEDRFQRAAQSDAKNTEALIALAETLYMQDKLPRAKHWLDQAMKRVARQPPGVLWLAIRIERKLGNQSLMQVFASRLQQDYPNSNEAMLYREGKFE
ncbi:MAG: type IV pilus biogenesis/stability protein PilW [Candidatus Dactylopiibacterium carminicum]|nr:MAG: type IV pilus biogenesis/stability protein PilW [Candidatus Dactylopiibacterium carminicum]